MNILTPGQIKVGRPKGGRKYVSQDKLDSLPDIGNASDFARALGVTSTTIQTWISLGAPAEQHKKTRYYTMSGPAIREWLLQTGRVDGYSGK